MREVTLEKLRQISLCTPMCDGFEEITKIIAELDYEIEELEKMYSQAVDATGAYIERAREAEAMVRDMDKGYLKLGLNG
jgi:hypothetical protein